LNTVFTVPPPFTLLSRESLASTNDEARSLAENGAADGLVVLAERQTSGRGRRGAAWFAKPGESLAFSIIVRPPEPKALWPRLALATGLAVAEAAESCVPVVGIKWPNDVWIARKKVAGILVEAGQDFAIVGIGINVNTLEFPPEVAGIATSLQLAAGRPLEREHVLTMILRHFDLRRRQIAAGFDELLDAVRLRCVLTGQAVTLITASGPREGVIEGIGPGGELLLRTANGLERVIQADEVRLSDRE
jgi:BirA family biotin operon repressor/biotin-[acetyl-CoA-carboxylase] ligase